MPCSSRDLALRASGDFGVLPKYDVAIIDEAHTLEAVAGEHLGLQISSLGVDFTLARLYNERTEKGLLAFHKLDDAIRSGADEPARRPTISSIGSPTGIERQPPGFNGRVRTPIGCPETLPEELRKLATAIGEGAQRIEQPEERIELDRGRDALPGAGGRDLGLAPPDGRPTRVYWVELENKTRHAGPARLGAAGRGTEVCAACCSTRSRPAS